VAPRFVNDCGGKFKIQLKEDKGAGKTVAWLLWGDHVRVTQTSGGFAFVKARGREGWVPGTCSATRGCSSFISSTSDRAMAC
jgi:hypothetical protein